jgi:predicted transcriptional regulator
MSWRPSVRRYRPRGHGVSKLLGELEASVMERLWKAGSATVREVHASLSARREGELAYTTVMTVMSRLAEKGLLRRFREGSAFRYRPAVERETFIAEASRDVFSGLARDLRGPVMAAFVDGLDDAEAETLEQLARLIETRRRRRR